MNHCWKCNRPVENGAAECEQCLESPTQPSNRAMAGLPLGPLMKVDMDKVKSVEDMFRIFKALDIFVPVGSPACAKMMPYLKPIP